MQEKIRSGYSGFGGGERLPALIRAAEPVPVARRAAKTRRWTRQRRHARRLPKILCPDFPRGIVEIDTVHLHVAPECHVKQFIAFDPVAKWIDGQAFRRATAAATRYFAKSFADMPFTVRAIQVDRGSNLKAAFEDAFQDLGLIFHELPPKFAEFNAGVERFNAT